MDDHLPDAWTRYVRVARAAEQETQTLAVGQMIWLQATHALEHSDEIRLPHRCARGLIEPVLQCLLKEMREER